MQVNTTAQELSLNCTSVIHVIKNAITEHSALEGNQINQYLYWQMSKGDLLFLKSRFTVCMFVPDMQACNST